MPSLAEIYPDLGQLSFPRPEGETVTLPDGRTLGYSVHVVRPSTTNDKPCTETCSINAAGDDSQLPAIILFPGTPGSRFFRHPALDDQSPHGSRMYILERPGRQTLNPIHLIHAALV